MMATGLSGGFGLLAAFFSSPPAFPIARLPSASRIAGRKKIAAPIPTKSNATSEPPPIQIQTGTPDGRSCCGRLLAGPLRTAPTGRFGVSPREVLRGAGLRAAAFRLLCEGSTRRPHSEQRGVSSSKMSSSSSASQCGQFMRPNLHGNDIALKSPMLPATDAGFVNVRRTSDEG